MSYQDCLTYPVKNSRGTDISSLIPRQASSSVFPKAILVQARRFPVPQKAEGGSILSALDELSGYRRSERVPLKNDLIDLAKLEPFLRLILVSGALGKPAADRLAELREIPGAEGEAPLHPKVQLELVEMIKAKVPLPQAPNMFLTSSGGLTLSWRLPDENSLIMVIEPCRTIYYDKHDGASKSFEHGNFDALSAALNRSTVNKA